MTRAAAGRVLEIACDESGSEGEKLIGGNTAVFAHASLRLTENLAAECIREVRRRAPSPSLEYKSDIIRRSKHRAALMWLLGPSSPLDGNAHVFLIDKAFHVVGRVIDLLPDLGPQQRRAMAVDLYREGRSRFGGERWTASLESFNDLMRTRNGRGPGVSVDAVFDLVDTLRVSDAGGRAGEIMDLLWQARARMAPFRTRLLDGPTTIPALDTLIPAIVRAVAYWGEGVRPVFVVHDQQTLLNDERIARLLSASPRTLSGIRLVDSRLDARIQVADLLAGAARQIAENELNGRGDEELTALLRPYVDASSIWVPAGAGVLRGRAER
ncbi:DUF3800 domain-containing protein [Nonomuraea africana]|uniref:DUF3800 domain-containing protein n=1 Tax=Nonomuraea africana TaxID=46171 RepID=UPI0033D03B3E